MKKTLCSAVDIAQFTACSSTHTTPITVIYKAGMGEEPIIDLGSER